MDELRSYGRANAAFRAVVRGRSLRSPELSSGGER
jgi:hypothetical protein